MGVTHNPLLQNALPSTRPWQNIDKVANSSAAKGNAIKIARCTPVCPAMTLVQHLAQGHKKKRKATI